MPRCERKALFNSEVCFLLLLVRYNSSHSLPLLNFAESYTQAVMN